MDIRALRRRWLEAAPEEVHLWKQVRGPLAAAMMSARRIGWESVEPFVWLTDNGVKLHMAQNAPKLIEWHVMQSVQRLIGRRIASKLDHPDMEGRRANVSAVARLLRSTAKDAFGPELSCTMQVIVANGAWPPQRQYEAGYTDDAFCELCSQIVPGGCADTVFHRAWECCAPEVVAIRNKHASPALIADALENRLDPLYSRGLGPHPADVHSGHICTTQVIEFRRNGAIIEDRKLWTLTGEVYYDGSCFKNLEAALSTATFGIVELDDDGNLAAEVKGTVPAS